MGAEEVRHMADLIAVLAQLGRINPAAWDFIVPMGPILAGRSRFVNPGEAVALNPQPIPPGSELHVAAALVARQIAQTAVMAEAMGLDPARVVSDAIDDWCGTKPRPGFPIPWPFPWPFPWPPLPPRPGPDPGPWDIDGARLVGAVSLAVAAAQMVDGPARQALSVGAEKLVETVSGGG
jgi:hypothetical protein